MPPDKPSPSVKFLITAKKAGTCKIRVEVYAADQSYLGSLPLETVIDGSPATEHIKIASLSVVVTVKAASNEDSQNFHPDAGGKGGSSDTGGLNMPREFALAWQLPIQILNSAIVEVPAARFALGVAGLATAIAIIRSLLTDLRVAVFGTVVMILHF
ncbi:MAG: hypothetical protein ACLGJB_05545 [Blastocatellia bacterium]